MTTPYLSPDWLAEQVAEHVRRDRHERVQTTRQLLDRAEAALVKAQKEVDLARRAFQEAVREAHGAAHG